MTNQLPVTLVMHEIMRYSRSVEVTYASKKSKTSQLLENSNDALYNIDAYVCNLKIKFERKECVSMASCEVL